MTQSYEQIARNVGWTWDEPAQEYRLNDNGEGYDKINTLAKSWYELCVFEELIEAKVL